MTSLQGAFSISDQGYRKYLSASHYSRMGDAALGLQESDFLNSSTSRAQIWLIEKATDGQNFRFRNYETGGALDINNSGFVAVENNSVGQVWEVNWLKGNALGDIYQIKNPLTSGVLVSNYHRDYDYHAVVSQSPRNITNEEWLIKPVLLPTLYWLINSAVPASVLRMSSHPNALDNTSREIALVPKDLSARNQLWKFEYTSDSESILRNASDTQFVLDLSVEDWQTLLARKHHGEPNQRWVVKDEDENNHLISLANVKTNTLFATRVRPLSGVPALNMLAVVAEGNTRWQLLPSTRPPFFWVTIQNSRSGAFLTQAEGGSIVPSMGELHANDHTVQWRFIMLDKDLHYVIVNRATGFMLQYYASTTSEISVIAESADRNNVDSHWMLDSAGNTNISIVNVGSKGVLDHYRGEGIQVCDPGTGDNYSYRQWAIMLVYDVLPSFALVNSHTGLCITNTPDPDIGTVTTTDNINDFKSQWVFYHPANGMEPDPEYILLNKMSGNVLEHHKHTRVEAQDISYMGPQQRWKLLPLRERGFALVNAATQQFLFDRGQSIPSTNELSPEDTRALCWQLVSRREPGFDFISWDFDILQRLLAHLSPRTSQELQRVMTRRLPTGEKKMKGKDKTTHIPRATRISQVTNNIIRTLLSHLIGRWEDDSIPETSLPHVIASIDRKKAEEQLGISLSDRPLRRRSDEPGWVRIELQGVYNVDGNWLANIHGQWLDGPVFQTIIPAGIQIGRTIIRRAMLQSLAEGLAVEVRVTVPTRALAVGKGGSLGTTPRPPGPEAGNGGTNQLALALGLIPVACLKHDEPQEEGCLEQDEC